MTYSDGSVYEGDWVNDQREGAGELLLASKVKVKGNFKNNMFIY